MAAAVEATEASKVVATVVAREATVAEEAMVDSRAAATAAAAAVSCNDPTFGALDN